MKRLILEMGTGNDLYGGNYTKAACRAVQDAIHHSSLTLFKSCGFDHGDMQVKVTIAVQQPDKVEFDTVAAQLPLGNASVTVVAGGLDVTDHDNDTVSVIATAAIEAYFAIDPAEWRISSQS
jgi:uncharacterized protein (TIGR02058 family)